jgi:two-component system, LuxR family, sensor kinase FixL
MRNADARALSQEANPFTALGRRSDEPGSAAAGDETLNHALFLALLVAILYFVGAKVGLALTFSPFPLAVLWPPNALVFGALLIAPTRWWWVLLLAVLPAHLLAETQESVPVSMVLCWYVSNMSEALIGAGLVRYLAGQPTRLETVHGVTIVCCAAATAAVLSSFLDATFVTLIGWGKAEFWALWKSRVFTNTLSSLMFVPVAITWAAGAKRLRQAEQARVLEAAILFAGLATVGILAFDSTLTNAGALPTLLYLPIPFFVWAALRFGPAVASTAFTLIAALVIWGAGHGQGPFVHAVASQNTLPIQIFLISVAVLVLFLAAMVQEREAAIQSLRISEELFATAFKSSPDAMAISRSIDGQVIVVNDRWLQLLSYPRALPGPPPPIPLLAHLVEADRPKLLSAMGGAGSGVRDLELGLSDFNGLARRVLVSVTPIQLQGAPCLINVVRDISAQRQAESEAREQRLQLTHLSRVASLTTFGGTLAHELTQPLTAVLNNAQAAVLFLEHDPVDMAEIRSALVDIGDAAKRAGHVIDHLRLLMQKGEAEFGVVDLNRLVGDVIQFAHGVLVSGEVAVSVDLAPSLPPIAGDAVQLEQLLLNLISNACDAMKHQDPAQRGITVSTSHSSDGSVQLLVADTGPGIDAAGLDSIFDPFYTTKEHGLGLGLAISRKIAQAHGGTLSMENRRGAGATFRLQLPGRHREGETALESDHRA